MKPYRVAVVSSADYPVRTDLVREVLGGLAEVTEENMPFRPLSSSEEAKYAEQLASYHGLLVRSGIFSASMLTKLDSLKIIAVHGVGVDRVDVAAAERLGIFVTNTPGANSTSVAELAVGLMINLIRRICLSSFRVHREGKWEEARHLGIELNGRKLGLLGVGQIGSKVAKIAQALGMNVYGYDPYVSYADLQIKGILPCGNVDDLLRKADVISLHLPLSNQTYHFIDETRIKLMRPGAILINTARGPLVDEKALYRALVSGHLSGAALDVFETEPPETNNPLFLLDSVIVTPHLGGSTLEALERIARIASKQIRSVLLGVEPEYAVNKPKNKERGIGNAT